MLVKGGLGNKTSYRLVNRDHDIMGLINMTTGIRQYHLCCYKQSGYTSTESFLQ